MSLFTLELTSKLEMNQIFVEIIGFLHSSVATSYLTVKVSEVFPSLSIYSTLSMCTKRTANTARNRYKTLKVLSHKETYYILTKVRYKETK